MLLLGATLQSISAAKVEVRTFYGLCDASAAVSLEYGFFAVGDDEDNVIRIYHPQAGERPVQTLNLSRFLEEDTEKPEADIEAAARIGNAVFWITSHGRNASGKEREGRHRFFATSLLATNGSVSLAPLGRPYEHLLRDLLSDPRLHRFHLAAAAELAPKEKGALNIEGLAATAEGHLWIGFRNPIPDEKALLVPLLNPQEIIRGGIAMLGDPVLLDLDGKGVRSISEWHGRFLIVAGSYDGGGRSDLYLWDGTGSEAERLKRPRYGHLNPEAIAEIPGVHQSDLLLVSDDGNLLIGKTPCKKLKDREQKRFRAALVPERTLAVPPLK